MTQDKFIIKNGAVIESVLAGETVFDVQKTDKSSILGINSNGTINLIGDINPSGNFINKLNISNGGISVAGVSKTESIFTDVTGGTVLKGINTGDQDLGDLSTYGYVEIATADDGTEPIYVRQYTGVFTSLVRTATLLNEAGNTIFPGSVAGSRFYAGYDSGQANSISCSNWFRSNDTTGWYNATYKGGITMFDSTYVRVSNKKSFWVDNNIVATGEVTSSSASDSRLKDNIEPISFALDFLGKVKTYEFDWNDKALSLNPLKTKKGAGVIAQEMSLLDNNFVHSIYGDYLGVDYDRFIPYLIGGVNEVNSKTITLGKRLDDTDSEVYKLKLRISELENKLSYYEHN